MSNHSFDNEQGLSEEQYLQLYDASVYKRPLMTVDMLIFTIGTSEQANYRKLSTKSLQLLLVKRGEHPFLGQWALPGGFVSVYESLDDAARRELESETNVSDLYMEQLYTWGDVGRDPRTRVISCSYMALVDNAALQIQDGEDADDADDARWFNVEYELLGIQNTRLVERFERRKLVRISLVNEIETLTATVRIVETVQGRAVTVVREIVDTGGIAFDHVKLIDYAMDRLRSKIEYTNIVFSLLPELFTLSELQQVYEVILGKELLAAAFRRKIIGGVVETDQYSKSAGHRPSKLYRMKSEAEIFERREGN